MEVWITRQEEKHRRYLPGILLESVLIFLVNGVGTFALLHTLIPSVNGIPFLMSVAVTALLCGFLLGLREHLVAAVFSLSAASGICLTVFSGALLNGFLSLWNQLADVLGKKAGIYLTIYQIKESGNANGELAVLIFLGIVCGLLGFLILKLRLYVLLLLFAAVLPVVLTKTGLLPDTRLCLGFYAGILLELNYMTKNKGGKSGTAFDVSAFCAGALGLLLVSAAGGGFLQIGIVVGNWIHWLHGMEV